MEGYTGTISPPGMYVRALYDYDADDRTSLSFHQGEIIQVLTQLESGWWDGVINGQRGWFPSNYCVLIGETEAARIDQGLAPREGFDAEDLSSEGDMDDRDFDLGPGQTLQNGFPSANGAQVQRDQEEAAFWIPQATPDGRLFYFNTMTGVSTVELPLESATSALAAGPKGEYRGSANAFASRQGEVRGPSAPGVYDEADYSASEAEDGSRSRSSLPAKRLSYLSDGASPATSMESLTLASANRDSHTGTLASSGRAPESHKSFATGATTLVGDPAAHKFFDDGQAAPLTWNRMLEDMRRSVERYRQAINHRERWEFVRRAEDMSDHLRLILAAGSGTTDNHSGTPSIISSNKTLYPHFRDMMSRFSKLVLSSHIAASDYAPGDQFAKCLQEADGVLNGVHGFVDVARAQRGEEIPRLFPGFVAGSAAGGNWQNNGFVEKDVPSGSFIEQHDAEPIVEPTVTLEHGVLDRMNDLKRLIVAGIRRLEEHFVFQEKIITHTRHKRLGDEVCNACSRVVELYRPWMMTMESINLAAADLKLQSSQASEFGTQKQRAYVYLAELVISCQAIAAPLADEWSNNRSDSLEERINRAKSVSKTLENTTSQVNYCLQKYLDTLQPSVSSPETVSHRFSQDTGHQSAASVSSKETGQSLLGDISSAVSFSEPGNPAAGLYVHGNDSSNSKIQKFFGEVPVSPRPDDDTPPYLRLEHEAEVQYDAKSDPPTIRGGTLTGLVEQLTRHDRYDAPFKVTFLLTYQSFTTAQELFELLIERWTIQPPSDITAEELNIWQERKQGPIRFRIVNVLKSWFDSYWMEGNDSASMDLIHKVRLFARDTVASSSTPGARPLMQVIEQRMRGEDPSNKRLVPNNVGSPQPILPKNMKKLKFQDIDPMEFARQLTIIESRLYGKIKPHECLNKIWQKKQPSDSEAAANVKALILHSNRLTNWVAEMILAQSETKKRVAVIKHFVAVADKCLAMSNFSTLTSIISALGTAPIHRLNRTWKEVNKATMSVLEKMRRMMGSTKNFTEYREALHAANPPCIPFFGVYLTDLTFIEDGIPSLIKKTDLINFAKRTKTAEIIREIQTYQNVSYTFKPVPELQDYILTMMMSAGDVHEMYEKSLLVEPREREDEKIARLLSESGFL